MPRSHSPRVRRTLVAALVASLMAPVARASEVSISVNLWLGGESSDWSDPLNWSFGGLYAAPNPLMPTYIGPSKILYNGVPTGDHLVPQREAVLGVAFSAPSMSVLGWDGLSQLRLVQGGLLTSTGSVGSSVLIDVYGGPQQAARLVLDGGRVAGSWQFFANSLVDVRAVYSEAQTGWYGTLGELSVASGASFSLGSSGLTVNRLTNSGSFNVAGGQTLTLAGQVVNHGTFTLAGNNTYGHARMTLAADTTLSGSGSTVLTTSTSGYSGAINGNSRTLTIAQGHTLRGAGNLGEGALNVVNQGTLLAEGSTPLYVNLGNGRSVDNTAGLVQVSGGAALNLQSGAVVGGRVESTGAGTGRLIGGGSFENLVLAGDLSAGGVTLSDVRITGQLAVQAGSTVNSKGVLDNQGTLALAGSSSGLARMTLAADTTLSGSGSTVLSAHSSGYSGAIYGGNKHTLTIAQGHTLRGAGYLGEGSLSLVNRGTVLADGGTLYVNPGSGSFVNEGLLQVGSAGVLNASGQTLRQTAAGAQTLVDGRLQVGLLALDAGHLTGTGVVAGHVTLGDAVLAPGHSPGKLGITGNLSLGDASLFDLDVTGGLRGSEYDWLEVGGNALLAGQLRLNFGSYAPQVGDSFEFLTTVGGTVSGLFASAVAPGYTLSMSYAAHGVTVTVAAISAVPEPSPWLLWLLGAVPMGMHLQRRRARAAV